MMKTYRVNDMFYSLQGEGYNTGKAAVFVRFAGCNLRCSFCDTDFADYTEMSADEIVKRANALCEVAQQIKPMVVLTGDRKSVV